MKITQLTTWRLPPRWMFLKIETDEGIVGWGEPIVEGRARTVEAAVHELGDYLIGQDPARINDLWQVMYRAGFYRGGPILMSAIAGIDQALCAIKSKPTAGWEETDLPRSLPGLTRCAVWGLIPSNSTAVRKWG